MASYTGSEVKSGFLIILAAILLLGVTFKVGNFMSGDTVEYRAQFGYVSGLEVNASVYFAGVEVGKVDSIEVIEDDVRPVILTMSVADHVTPRDDSFAVVDNLSMMGEKIIEISPGTEAGTPVKPGATIRGRDPIPMYLMIEKMNLLADRMEELSDALNPLMTRTNDILAKHEEEIHKMIANFHQISANVRDMTNDLKFRPWRLVRKG